MWAIEHAYRVALRKESVDRNSPILTVFTGGLKSLSARRAWIEMYEGGVTMGVTVLSLSARRAWIEIPLLIA